MPVLSNEVNAVIKKLAREELESQPDYKSLEMYENMEMKELAIYMEMNTKYTFDESQEFKDKVDSLVIEDMKDKFKEHCKNPGSIVPGVYIVQGNEDFAKELAIVQGYVYVNADKFPWDITFEMVLDNWSQMKGVVINASELVVGDDLDYFEIEKIIDLKPVIIYVDNSKLMFSFSEQKLIKYTDNKLDLYRKLFPKLFEVDLSLYKNIANYNNP